MTRLLIIAAALALPSAANAAPMAITLDQYDSVTRSAKTVCPLAYELGEEQVEPFLRAAARARGYTRPMLIVLFGQCGMFGAGRANGLREAVDMLDETFAR